MYLLTGGSGQLGTELQKHKKFYAPDRLTFDVVNPDEEWLVKSCPDIEGIVHCAAMTNVNKIEKDMTEAMGATLVNVLGTGQMAVLANDLNVPLFHISTETCVKPYNTYAKTKLLSEGMARMANKYSIIRTSFRNDPFEYDQAPTDMYTIGDYVDKIAELIVERLDYKHSNSIEYIGTGVKTMYELASKTREVKKTTVEEMNKTLSYKVETMDELNEVSCYSTHNSK